MRSALAAGATREEILFVLKCATVLSLHSCSVAAPVVVEEARSRGVGHASSEVTAVATPACDAMRAAGQWNSAWDPFVELDPAWTDEFMATGVGIYGSGVMSAKEVELLSIALDAWSPRFPTICVL
jgi:alkylhydroperoxidase/carboxymuconolactone decarboxylase family protein YurZ